MIIILFYLVYKMKLAYFILCTGRFHLVDEINEIKLFVSNLKITRITIPYENQIQTMDVLPGKSSAPIHKMNDIVNRVY